MKRRLILWLLKQAAVRRWLTTAQAAQNLPRVDWKPDDGQALRGFLDTASGQKLLQEMENTIWSADVSAIVHSTPENAYGHLKFARGVRQVVAKIKTLSAVRTEPDNHENEAESLPPDLEHLSDT